MNNDEGAHFYDFYNQILNCDE